MVAAGNNIVDLLCGPAAPLRGVYPRTESRVPEPRTACSCSPWHNSQGKKTTQMTMYGEEMEKRATRWRVAQLYKTRGLCIR